MNCPIYASFFGFAGSALSISLAAIGASYATARAGVAIANVGIRCPSAVVKSLLPVVLAGVLSINGLIVSVMISNSLKSKYSLLAAASHLGAGFSVGFSALIAGWTIGVVGERSVQSLVKQPRFFVGMVFILIFCEVLSLYGLIVGLLLNTSAVSKC